MDTNATEPEPIAEAAMQDCNGCARCSAGGMADPTAEHMAMLLAAAQVCATIIQAVGRKSEPTETDLRICEGFCRSMRRTLAVRQKMYDNSRKSPAQRHAEQLRRIDAQERARYQVRRATIQRAVESAIDAEVARRGVPGDREDLLADMRERLEDVDIERAETAIDISAIVLGICKAMGIVPRNEIWSDAAMAEQVHRHHDASCKRPAEPEEPVVPEPCGTGAEVTIDGTTFNPDGSFKCKEFDPPEEDWPSGILDNPPIDLMAMRHKPPDTG